MRNAGIRYLVNGVIVLVVFVMAIACSGGTDSPVNHFEDPNGTPGTQGNINPGTGGTGGATGGSPVVGALGSAPLGTDPSFQTQEISELITTVKVEDSGTSSVRTASAEDRVLWVAISKRGDPPIPGTDAPPIREGDQIDLHIRYQVFEGELTISRQWILEAAGLNYIEPAVSHNEPGTYQALFPFTLAYGTRTASATFKGVIGPIRQTSVVVIPDMHDYREVEFEIENYPTLQPIYFPPANPDDLNDSTTHAKGCLPDEIVVEFNGSYIEVWVYDDSDDEGYDISNVVLEFSDGTFERWEDLTVGRHGTFYGTGENDGKTIVRAWIKSGCNESADGTGFGEMFEPGVVKEMAMAQFAWEDDINTPDYDYNDFVGRLRIAEIRNNGNDMVQLQLTARAMARSTSYDASWQFNIGAAFPGATNVIAIVDQYYHNGTRHGPQRIYWSAGGMSIPIFSPTRLALPNPPGSYATNGEAGTLYIDGDYAEVIVILHEPQPQGSYTPMPYEPQLLVDAGDGGVWTISLWSKPGDPLNDDGLPGAFIVPDTFAWPLEGEPIYSPYPDFNDWIDWINDQTLDEPSPPWWQYDPADSTQYFKRELFL